jgi:SAM-dependent methyltransferase
MPFRAAFDCLWCGSSYATRSGTDIEGWAQLCPDCVGKAGDNGFLRFRLRQALTERSAGAQPVVETAAAVATASPAAAVDVDRSLIEYYEARAPEYDDWYLRRGRYERGAIHDAAWNAELDAAGRWLDALPWHGDIVELAAGTGWWSPLLASRGELSLYDTSAAALDRARERLLAHGLRAHLHVRDAWAEPDRRVDGLFMGFWLSHVARDRLPDFLALAHRWLKPGGRLAFIDSLPDPASGAVDHPAPKGDRALRRLDDGREFTIVKVFHDTHDLGEALDAEGFPDSRLSTTGRFFVLGSAVAGRESA